MEKTIVLVPVRVTLLIGNEQSRVSVGERGGVRIVVLESLLGMRCFQQAAALS